MSNKLKFWTIIIISLLVIALIVYIIIRSKKVKERSRVISDAIDKGIGALGKDIDSILVNVSADPSYVVSQAVIDKLSDAKGSYIMPDHPEYIVEVFAGKTKSQIKSIINKFTSQYGKFNDHLNSIFDDTFGYDTEGYNKILGIVMNAR